MTPQKKRLGSAGTSTMTGGANSKASDLADIEAMGGVIKNLENLLTAKQKRKMVKDVRKRQKSKSSLSLTMHRQTAWKTNYTSKASLNEASICIS